MTTKKTATPQTTRTAPPKCSSKMPFCWNHIVRPWSVIGTKTANGSSHLASMPPAVSEVIAAISPRSGLASSTPAASTRNPTVVGTAIRL